ncbi:adenosine deaminase [Pseudomonas sp. LA5]|uniref:adenosine deaminase n=1 Tax=Pseudomonas sp. LA5 TaxID=3027850 RepID=UPI0023618B4B|nr:adenosine deaminase [Pseudomonas sp. LA5]
MIENFAENRFFVRSLVELAKASMSNLDMLARLELGASGGSADTHLKSLCLTAEGRATITKSFVTGRFLRFRKLHPLLTDEALEHKLAWAIAGLAQEQSDWSRDTVNEPGKCIIPLLTRLARTFLCEARDGSLRVRSCYLAEWQDLVLVVPPMLVSAAWMAVHTDGLGDTISNRRIFQQRVQGWLCDSTLPVDDDPFLDHLCRVEGLDEAHMHLNGTTEADKVWMDALRKPSNVVGAISSNIGREHGMHAAIGNGVNRLLIQEDSALTPKLLLRRVESAVDLKSFLLETLGSAQEWSFSNSSSLQQRYAAAVRGRVAENGMSATTAEALQLVDIIISIKKSRDDSFRGLAFFWYALIRAQFCRLLVQQVEQKGFDQFQYITFNELRENTEKDFAERFRQIDRGLQQPIDFLEGRFAPKTTPDGTAIRLMQILRGYLQFLDERPDGKSRGILRKFFSDKKEFSPSLSTTLGLVRSFENGKIENGEELIARSERRLRLGLVVHFIKKTDSDERGRFKEGGYLAPVCRDSKARREADQSARALVMLMNSTAGLSEIIRGVDAASNERHSGPEVFAQVFRRLSRAGIKRFTYHVGEDFVHIASGLRAIHEAVRFLDLSAGCRIGHGTAAGLVPSKWWSSVGGALVQPLEDRLDDLVFAWGTLSYKGVLLDRLPLLDLEIRRLSMQIWQDPVLTPDLLLRAWQLRHLDPTVRDYGMYDVDRERNAEIQLFQDCKSRDPDAHTQFLRRHGVGVANSVLKHGAKPVLVTRETDVLDIEVLEVLQLATLELLQERRIAIETLPSSNVRISIHQAYEDHHAVGWLGVGKKLGSAAVIIGSDDPGIFATSLRAEYAHLLRALESNGAGLEATKILENMNTNSKRFRF